MPLNFFNDGDPWMLAEDIPDIDFQFSQIWLSSFVNGLYKSCGKNYKKILCVYNGYNLKFYYGENDSNEFAQHLLKKIIKNPSYGKKINDNIRKYSDKLKYVSTKLEPNILKKLTNKEIIKLYNELDNLHTTLYSWGWLPNAIDMFHGNFTNYFKALLLKKLPENEVSPALLVLSASREKSIFNHEHESFLKLVIRKEKKFDEEKIKKAINVHLKKYFYLKHLWLGKSGVYDFYHYTEEINKFIKSGKSAKMVLKNGNQAFKNTQDKRNKLIIKLKFDKKQIELFNIYAEFAVTKVYRRDAQIFWSYMMEFLFLELSKRLRLSVMQVRFMFPDEIVSGLSENKINIKLKVELKKRTKYCVYYAEKNIDIIYYGDKGKKIEKLLSTYLSSDIKEFSGSVACAGKAKGRVKIINTISDMDKMKKGDILASIATNPDIVSAMKKAAAVITEQGGITSHAAIVSRELNIPCVIGTKIATKVLKDGDLVEVDAIKGIIKIITN